MLHLQRNEISRNWAELKSCTVLRELDISRNRLQWPVGSRDFDEALNVLSSLKRLRELRLAHNPVAPTGTYGLTKLLFCKCVPLHLLI